MISFLIFTEKLNSIGEAKSDNAVINKVAEIRNFENDDADSQYGSQTSNSIDDLVRIYWYIFHFMVLCSFLYFNIGFFLPAG